MSIVWRLCGYYWIGIAADRLDSVTRSKQCEAAWSDCTLANFTLHLQAQCKQKTIWRVSGSGSVSVRTHQAWLGSMFDCRSPWGRHYLPLCVCLCVWVAVHALRPHVAVSISSSRKVCTHFGRGTRVWSGSSLSLSLTVCFSSPPFSPYASRFESESAAHARTS